jgi:hypothetical protein
MVAPMFPSVRQLRHYDEALFDAPGCNSSSLETGLDSDTAEETTVPPQGLLILSTVTYFRH